MRGHAYQAFEIVAWPAACWGVCESVLRLATCARDGLAPVALLTACAAGTIVLSRLRTRQLPAGKGR
jgi:hypothetical protein